MSWVAARIAAKTQEARDVVSFELAAADGSALPPFGAGAHIDVEIAPGLVRQYSLCNPSKPGRYAIAVLREASSRGGSIAMHGIEVGHSLRVGEPRNLFALTTGAPASVLIAGGIGITPILCMAERISHASEPFVLHYAARSRDHAAFVERSAALGARFAFADRGDRLDIPAILAEAPDGAHVYVCGPSGLMSSVIETAKALGWADDRIHREVFAATTTEQGDAFDVVIASTGLRIAVPAKTSVVAALAEHGIEVPTSCEQGVCGTCVTHVLEGVPDHRDTFLTPSERKRNDQFTPCCSRAKTPVLVLDL